MWSLSTLALCRYSTGTDPVTDPMTLGSVAKVVRLWEKLRKNAESVLKSTTGRYSYRQTIMTFLTRRRVGTFFARPVVELLRHALNP